MPTIDLPALLPWQAEVKASKARYKVVRIGRRSGKSYVCKDDCIEGACGGQFHLWNSIDYPALQEHWDELVELCEQIPGVRINRADRMIRFPGGGRISCKSVTRKSSLRGIGPHSVKLDEFAFYPDQEEIWEDVIQPSLLTHRGGAIFASTPDGYNFFSELCRRGEDPNFPEWKSWHIPTWVANPSIPQSEFDTLRDQVSDRSFRQEYGAEFVARLGAVFPNFSRNIHVKPQQYRPHLPVEFGWDFGRRVTAVTVHQVEHDEIDHGLDCFKFEGMTTAQTGRMVKESVWGDRVSLICCDPAGDSGNLQTNDKDVEILRAMFPNARVVYSTLPTHRNPGWRADRIGDRMLSASGIVRFEIDPGAKEWIESIEQTVYPKGSETSGLKEQPVKDGKHDHFVDAHGYHEVGRFHLTAPQMLTESPL